MPDKGISLGSCRSSSTPKPVGGLGRMGAVGLRVHRDKGKGRKRRAPLGITAGEGGIVGDAVGVEGR